MTASKEMKFGARVWCVCCLLSIAFGGDHFATALFLIMYAIWSVGAEIVKALGK